MSQPEPTQSSHDDPNIMEESISSAPKRKRTSKAWEDFDEINGKDGSVKVVCKYCSESFKPQASGATTQLLRHTRACRKRPRGSSTQPLLQLTKDMGTTSLNPYKYDKDGTRDLLAKMIIVHDLPFNFVGYEFFNAYSKSLNPQFKSLTRNTIKDDCMKLYEKEKEKLKGELENVSRINLTSDMWTSNQNIGYMSLTGHYLDSDWKLQKKILNFMEVQPPHKGLVISDAICQCLGEWNIENKVATITLDNAAVNDSTTRIMRENFEVKGNLAFCGKIFQVRCCAHILNLIVQDGLEEIKDIVDMIRNCARYLHNSTSRQRRFDDIVKQLRLPDNKRIPLDCTTRWNSTFLMLKVAIEYSQVFPRLKERDSQMKYSMTVEDWKKVTDVCEFLEAFNNATLAFSGTKYPTSNLFLPEVWKIKELLLKKLLKNDDILYSMAIKMNEKFEKYWSECNLVLAIATVLDPRYKLKLLRFCFPRIYPDIEVCATKIGDVHDALKELFQDYSQQTSSRIEGVEGHNYEHSTTQGNENMSAIDEYRRFVIEEEDAYDQVKSELDIYLGEGVLRIEGGKFDVLQWWKEHSLRFRVLSRLARDVLAIPISTVASESAFSTGGRVVSKFRSSLKSETVQAMVCTGDWMRCAYGVEKTTQSEDHLDLGNAKNGNE